MRGPRIHSDYDVEECLGEGSMGSVFRAQHRVYGYRVAIKFLHPHLAGERELVQRFLGESEAASRIRHPGMVDIFEAGANGDTAYLVMEYLEGESLETKVMRGRIALARVVDYARQIASVLAAAHRAGIVHRDLKPDNVFITRDPVVFHRERVKLLDFGVAKFFDDRRTNAHSVFGTPNYMAPEQVRGAANAGTESDIYALGAMLYEMVTGRPPFTGTVEEVMAAHRRTRPRAPSQLAPMVPPALERLILDMLEKEPRLRPPNMLYVASELAAVAAGLSDPGVHPVAA
jgi:serine/threonine-protein kinase